MANANCTATHLTSALKPLDDAFGLEKVFVVSMQSVSGVGYPGVSTLDILDNVIPDIGNEEPEEAGRGAAARRWAPWRATISTTPASPRAPDCNRAATLDGHLECVSVALRTKATPEQAAGRCCATIAACPRRWACRCPPDPCIIVRDEPDRPQVRLDRMAGHGMATVVGRIRPDPILDLKFVLLGDNTVRGAAGGSVLNAELLFKQGYIK